LNTRLRNGILISIAGVVLVTLGIFFLTRLVSQSLAPLPPPAQPTPISARVVVTTRDLALGEVISEGDVSVIDVPIELAPRNTISNIEAVLGRITRVELVEGEMVLEHLLADPTNINHDQAYVLGENQVLMAFQPSDLMTSMGIIQRGDIVDILITYDIVPGIEQEGEAALAQSEEQGPQAKTYTFSAFQIVEITAMVFDVVTQEETTTSTVTNVGQEEPPREVRSTDINIQAYLLGLTPQDALLLKHLKDTGAVFDLVVRNPASTRLFGLTPITTEFLIDKYGLTIAP
jgi:pilus assembly protein CpaB